MKVLATTTLPKVEGIFSEETMAISGGSAPGRPSAACLPIRLKCFSMGNDMPLWDGKGSRERQSVFVLVSDCVLGTLLHSSLVRLPVPLGPL